MTDEYDSTKHDGNSLKVEGKFRRVRIDPLDHTGQFNRAGSFQLTEDGLKIKGFRVLSLGARWGIGLGLAFGTLFLTYLLTGGAFYFAPGFIPIYFLVEYLLFKREELLIPYENINRIAGDAKQALVGVEFDEDSYRNCAVLKSPEWSSLFLALKEATIAGEGSTVIISEIDEKDLEKKVTQAKPWTKSKVAIFSALVGFGWYLLFFILYTFVLRGIFALTGIPDLPGIRNTFVRILNWILLFLIPAVPTYFLTRRYFRKRMLRVEGNLQKKTSR